MRSSPLLLLAFAGCMTTGTNISGSFTCDAPDGVCAPLTAIDNAAIRSIEGTLAEMEGRAANRPREGSILASYGEEGTPVRTNERTAKIVFPARIDANGMYHEATVVHAVVERPVWVDALRGPEPRRRIQQTASGEAGTAANVTKRGSALASMDELVAARAARREYVPAEAMAGSDVRAAAPVAAPVAVSVPASVDGTAAREVEAKRQGKLWVGPEQASAAADASAADVESAAATRTLHAVSLSAASAGGVLMVGNRMIAESDAGEEPQP